MPFDPAKIKAVIFDMDGVLLDTEILYKKVSNQAANQLGFDLPAQVHASTIGAPNDRAKDLIIAGMPADFPFETYDAHWRLLLEQSLEDKVPVKAGVVDLLTWLNDNKVPAAVATSTGLEKAHDHLHRANLKPHFAAIVTRGDVQNGKPHPEPFLTAASRLNVEPQHCLAIEDSYNGVRAASAAGMHTIMVPDMLPPTQEVRDLCRGVLKNLAAIQSIFEQGGV